MKTSSRISSRSSILTKPSGTCRPGGRDEARSGGLANQRSGKVAEWQSGKVPALRCGAAPDAASVPLTLPLGHSATLPLRYSVGMSNGSPKVDDWRTRHLWEIQPVRDGLVIAAVVGLVYLGFKLSFVTVPMLLAMTLAYLFEPLVQRLTRRGLVGRAPVALGIIVVAALLVVVPTVVGGVFGISQGAKLVQTVAGNIEAVTASVRTPEDSEAMSRVRRAGRAWVSIRDYVVHQESIRKAHEAKIAGHADEPAGVAGPEGAARSNEPAPQERHEADPKAPSPSGKEGPSPTGVEALTPAIEEAPSDVYRAIQWLVAWVQENAGSLSKNLLNAGGGAAAAALATATSLARFAFGGFLTAFFFFFFCNGYGRVLQFWEGLIPEKKKSRVFFLAAKMDRVIAGFVRGRLTISAILIGYYSLAYWLAGVPAPLIIGPIVGALTVVPYAAGIVGIPLSMLLLWLEPGGGWQGQWWWIIGAPLLVTGIAQAMDDYVLTPKIQGDATGMDTPSILFASIAGGLLAGFYGILLAIPTAACAKILLKELVWPRFKEWSEGRASDFLPIGRE
ncbi:MAG: AI-2E family transporter [Tepidisphaera sp.]|nr:AI-2E family transporter [Tepidisphaera sp.]